MFAEVLLLAVIDAAVGEVESFGDVGELSLIAFSLACRLHLYRWFCFQRRLFSLQNTQWNRVQIYTWNQIFT